MCDDRTEQENEAYLGKLTRRDFNRLSVGAAVASALPVFAYADADIVERDVVITTPDGEADCHFACPGKGKHAAVLVWPDILGLRPAFREMGRQLARAGYAVLTVNPYYRQAKSPVVEPGASFSDEATRNKVRGFARALSVETNVTDAGAFTTWLDAQAEVDTSRGIGTTGYCMGGSMTMRTAAAVPARVRAGASFHGGRLVTDKEDSPHLLVENMQAHYLIAIAENDDEREPQTKDVLRKTFDAAGLPAEIEVYEGAMHGWCSLDSRVYNKAQAERAWSRLLHLFETALA